MDYKNLETFKNSLISKRFNSRENIDTLKYLKTIFLEPHKLTIVKIQNTINNNGDTSQLLSTVNKLINTIKNNINYIEKFSETPFPNSTIFGSKSFAQITITKTDLYEERIRLLEAELARLSKKSTRTVATQTTSLEEVFDLITL